MVDGVATGLDVLNASGLADLDEAMVVTDEDRANRVAGLWAAGHGDCGVMTLLKGPEVVPFVVAFGRDAVRSPHLMTAGAILRPWRRGQVGLGWTSVYTEAETHEMAEPRACIVGQPLRTGTRPARGIAGAVAQGTDRLIPSGDPVIQTHDRGIVLTRSAVWPEVEWGCVGALALSPRPRVDSLHVQPGRALERVDVALCESRCPGTGGG